MATTNIIHVPHAQTPRSGDYGWLGAVPGSTADRMYTACSEDWLQAINSRFVDELLDDTLPSGALRSYLIQDFKFFNQMIMDRAMQTAPRREIRDMLAEQSKFFADEEEPYFRNFLREYQVSDEEYERTPQTPANADYCRYLDGFAQRPWSQVITALCCMEWLYLAWAKRTVDASVTQRIPAHKGWVDLHEGPLFRAWVGRLIALVNEFADADGEDGRVFSEVVRLERRFFEDSYPA